MAVPEPAIITCDEWGAAQPRGPLLNAMRPRPTLTVFHHTAGYAGADKKAYARMLQRDMMWRRGWADSGHSFLVCRDGSILEGRHGSIDAIRRGHVRIGAHCPGYNNQPGVEHEHVVGDMTDAQFVASVKLHAWIADRCGIPVQDLARPHGDLFATACPGDLRDELGALRLAVGRYLDQHRGGKRRDALRSWILARKGEGRSWAWIKRTANWREFKRLNGR